MSARRKAELFITAVCDPDFITQLEKALSKGAHLENGLNLPQVQLNISTLKARQQSGGVLQDPACGYARIRLLTRIAKSMRSQNVELLAEELLLSPDEIDELEHITRQRRAARANSSSN